MIRRRVVLLSLLSLFALALPALAQSEAPPEPIDINAAGVEELTSVRGIGKVTAERIVAFRKEHGPFERVEDLLKVRGIGEKSLARIAPHVTVKRRG